jgi:hypothetical protein
MSKQPRLSGSVNLWCVLIAVGAVLIAPPAAADDSASLALDDFFPLVTRRPVLERELEVRVSSTKRREGRETRIAPSLAMPIGSWWQLTLELPVVFTNPRLGDDEGGASDVELESKFLVFQSTDSRTQLSIGFSLTLPTGSERRDLGGQFAIEPFLSAGTMRDRFYLVAEMAYGWSLNDGGPRPKGQTLTAGVAAGYAVRPWLIPLLELTTVTRVGGTPQPGDRGRRGQAQLYIGPGVNVQLLRELTLGIGFQLPVTSVRTFDYALYGSLNWGF